MVTKEEYLKLLEEVLRQENEDYIDKDVDCNAWIPADPPEKKRIPERIGSIDITKLKKDAIKNSLHKYQQFVVGSFLVTIVSSKESFEKTIYDICIYETKFSTPMGRPCNMQYKVDVFKDVRFENRPWLNSFSQYSSKLGKNISEETLVDILVWLKAITKLPAFI